MGIPFSNIVSGLTSPPPMAVRCRVLRRLRCAPARYRPQSGAARSSVETVKGSAQPMLTMRMTGVHDYSVFDDGQRIGRIRFASERTPGIWLFIFRGHRSGAPPASMTPSGTSKRRGWRSKRSTDRKPSRRPIAR
jgi:hypothetical protein